MIEIFKLTKRHVDKKKGEELPQELKEVKLFSTFIGHGIGTIDYSEKIASIKDEEYEQILQNSGEYVRFKIGNLSKYFEIEVFPEHSKKLLEQMCECELKEIFKNFKDGYLVLRKDFDYD